MAPPALPRGVPRRGRRTARRLRGPPGAGPAAAPGPSGAEGPRPPRAARQQRYPAEPLERPGLSPPGNDRPAVRAEPLEPLEPRGGAGPYPSPRGRHAPAGASATSPQVPRAPQPRPCCAPAPSDLRPAATRPGTSPPTAPAA